MAKEFIIPVVWEMWGKYVIEAETLEEAMEKALDSELPLPEESYYVDDSIQVDMESLEYWKENMPKEICEGRIE